MRVTQRYPSAMSVSVRGTPSALRTVSMAASWASIQTFQAASSRVLVASVMAPNDRGPPWVVPVSVDGAEPSWGLPPMVSDRVAGSWLDGRADDEQRGY